MYRDQHDGHPAGTTSSLPEAERRGDIQHLHRRPGLIRYFPTWPCLEADRQPHVVALEPTSYRHVGVELLSYEQLTTCRALDPAYSDICHIHVGVVLGDRGAGDVELRCYGYTVPRFVCV